MIRGLEAALLALAAGAPGGPGSDLLVSTRWLDENMIRPEIAIVDVRSREHYNQSHLSNAAWLDLSRLLNRESKPPTVVPPEEFKALAEAAGIVDGAHVVVVDDGGGFDASRLWWALGYHGFDRVSLLDGGFARWEMEGRSVAVEAPFPRPGAFTPKPRPEWAATAEQVKAWRTARPGGVILDARPLEEFSGARARGKRAGRIPGAVNLPWSQTLTEEEGARVFRSAEELKALYQQAGVGPDSAVVAYDHDGKRAPQVLFGLALLGYRPGACYVGSWAEWSARDELPVEGAPAAAAPSKGKAKAKSGKAQSPASP
jgi:thiosulfate/3-mercaptopyruvate sulfurtransferase